MLALIKMEEKYRPLLSEMMDEWTAACRKTSFSRRTEPPFGDTGFSRRKSSAMRCLHMAVFLRAERA